MLKEWGQPHLCRWRLRVLAHVTYDPSSLRLPLCDGVTRPQCLQRYGRELSRKGREAWGDLACHALKCPHAASLQVTWRQPSQGQRRCAQSALAASLGAGC